MERQARRHTGSGRPAFAASLICGSRSIDGIVRNLTPQGAMFESIDHLAAGARVDLQIQGLCPISSSVAWSLGPRAGLRFDHPLPATGSAPTLSAIG